MIQTVTGPISKHTLRNTLMHEHISCASTSFVKAFGSAWLDKEQLKTLACDVLQKAKEAYGLDLLVDATPMDLGRDVALLKEISQLSGVSIVASTGFYYLQSIEAMCNSPAEIAKWLTYECQNGIEDSNIRPGILKCATGKLGITKDNYNKLSALGIVQKETGLPLYVHCEHKGDVAFQQLYLLRENGASIEKTIIGHAAIRPDADYLEQILSMGCYVCMDQCHCYPQQITAIASTLARLCEKGYASRLLVANDACIHSDFSKLERNGLQKDAKSHADRLGYVFDRVHSAYLSVGGSEENWQTMLCKNPADVLNV